MERQISRYNPGGFGKATGAWSQSSPRGWRDRAIFIPTTGASLLQASTSSPAHDGFTLSDLVSYNHKHNAANAEENRDGENHNNSWNCGVEGPCDDREVLNLRIQQRRNLMSTLLLSQGVPMILGGDELGRTQGGNNNAYCQDNEISWLDWRLNAEEQGLRPVRAAPAAIAADASGVDAAKILPRAKLSRRRHEGYYLVQSEWQGNGRQGVARAFCPLFGRTAGGFRDGRD